MKELSMLNTIPDINSCTQLEVIDEVTFFSQTESLRGEQGVQGSLGRSLQSGWGYSQSASNVSGRRPARADDDEWRTHPQVHRAASEVAAWWVFAFILRAWR